MQMKSNPLTRDIAITVPEKIRQEITSETECVYKYVYLCILMIIKQQSGSNVNKIKEKLFKPFNVIKV